MTLQNAHGKAHLRILLVNPPFRYFPGINSSKSNYTRPPLGIAYLASYLKKYLQTEIEVNIIDCEAENLYIEKRITKEILKKHPAIVGFSVVTGTWHVVSALASSLKRINSKITTLAGGPHITAMPEEFIPGIDVKIFGEGEESLLEYITEVYLGGAKTEIKGCIQFKDGEVISHGKTRPFISDLDRIPIPSRELLPKDRYFHTYPYPNVTNFTTMFTSRGCLYNCSFCANRSIWGSKVRFHSLERTYEEIDLIANQGANLVFIDDDTFTIKKKRVYKICEFIRKYHPSLRWVCHVRADTLDEDMLSEMKKSGCVEVQIGVESGNAEILKKTDKSLCLEDIRKAFDLLNKAQINSWATFVFGCEGDTAQTINDSITFAKEINPTYCSFIVLLPLPGTTIFNKYSKSGFISTYDWSRYSWHGKPVISLDSLSAEDLVAWRKKANLSFYLRPKKLLKNLINTIKAFSLREMRRNYRAWIDLVTQR